jgi:hydrogenase maturation protease
VRTPVAWNGKTLVLGLGNDLLTDDAIGLHLVRELQKQLADEPHIDVRETTEMGLALLDFLSGYEQAFIVDSIQFGQDEPGHLREFDPAGFADVAGRTPHFLGVAETLALGRELGLPMPASVRIFGIQVADPYTLGLTLSPQLEAAFPTLLESIGAFVRAAASG